ncbi:MULTISPECIES: hypothetical protein [unclassified Janthinobacterium]|uniref:hypothetical protein n=1 Tax=unclassified Janthinobacterium TaxID=2610881 RepID=UPI0018C9245A|nr:hypothetical protein [Janthinobacterium sp. CG_23.4]MDH6157439.1 hypothetical protein [Janthinobacterium sp. CG_23.4]
MDFTVLLGIFKALGKGAIMELVKNKWIQFSIGAAILMLSSQGLVKAVRWW